MSETTAEALPSITDLEARQDEVLRQLDDLNRRIERTLREHSPQRVAVPSEAPPVESISTSTLQEALGQ